MPPLDRKQLDHLERRELQLSISSAIFVLILAAGLASFMYPLVFVHPDETNKWTLRVAFFGFCGLTVLFVVYLLERQRTVRKLKQHILSELERNLAIRHQASVDLLHSMPDANHFWDRLTMEFRRAATMEHTLSLLLVQSKSEPGRSKKDDATGLSDAAKVISRKLRPTDSVYRLSPDLFGLILQETDGISARRIAVRLQEELHIVKPGPSSSFTLSVHNYPEDVQSAHELEEIVRNLLPNNESWETPVPTLTTE
jgi:GGDEF domain-containing protein